MIRTSPLLRHRLSARPRHRSLDVRLEPLPGLEWSLLMEEQPPGADAMSPAALRRGWVHRAPQEQVLSLFRRLTTSGGDLPVPWWLRALDLGRISSRAEAFEIEDTLHELLGARAGWSFVPWVGAGESVYWEYEPSDRALMIMPTTVVLTHQHTGWISVVPAHGDTFTGSPTALGGVSELESSLARIEAW